MNYYAFHLGDYASATAHLSWEEDLAYRRLMDAYYRDENPLPLDARLVHRLVRAFTDEQRDAVDAVLVEFFDETPDGWRHSRCDAEIEAISGKREKASKSAKARWEKANAMRTQCERNANAMPSQCERIENGCERIENGCERNAPNPNPNPNPKGEKNSAKEKLTIGLAELVAMGVQENHAKDWLAVRKQKKAPLTQTALDGMLREAAKAGINIADAVRIAAERSWQAFKADWLDKPGIGLQARPAANRQQQVEDANAQLLQEILAQEAARTGRVNHQHSLMDLDAYAALEGEVIREPRD